nr:putative ferric reductase transmembrane component [Quercus suber]
MCVARPLCGLPEMTDNPLYVGMDNTSESERRQTERTLPAKASLPEHKTRANSKSSKSLCLQPTIRPLLVGAISLSACTYGTRSSNGGFDDPDITVKAVGVSSDEADHRRQVLHGIDQNRDLILIYHAILVGAVLSFAVRHWIIRIFRWRASRKCQGLWNDGAPTEADVSSASTNFSSLTGARDVTHYGRFKENTLDEERRPLLTSDMSERAAVTFTSRYLRRCNSFAIYQAPNLPLFNKVFPSVLCTAVIVLFVGSNIFFVFYDISFDVDMLIVFSDRTAILFAANLPWLYLLAAKNQPLRLLTGYSYEGLNIIHRRLGELMCILPLLHGVAMLIVWWYGLRPIGVTAWLFFTHPRIVTGIAAFVCYEALYFTSLASFRNWCYEIFLASHIILQCAALAILYFHHPGGRKYIAIALAVFLLDRVVFRLGVKSKTFKADLTVMEDGKTVLLSRNWALEASGTKSYGLNIAYGWKTMEHIFITVPALGKAHVLQSHPFTIASAAPDPSIPHAWLNLIVRTHNGFTRRLLDYARTHSSATVRIDGPYGSPLALEMLDSCDITMLVAGGSGIAVAYPILWALLHNLENNDNESPSQPIRNRKVGLLWVIHDAAHIDWIGQDRLDDLCAKGLQLYIPGPTSTAGRPDLPTLTRRLVHDMAKASHVKDPKLGVVVSGPDGMNRMVRNSCAKLAWEGWDVNVEVEKYGCGLEHDGVRISYHRAISGICFRLRQDMQWSWWQSE